MKSSDSKLQQLNRHCIPLALILKDLCILVGMPYTLARRDSVENNLISV